MREKQHLTQFTISIILYLLLAATATIYWPGLSSGLMLDDFANLRPLEQLDNHYTTLRDVIFSNESGLLGRPISMLSFAANYVFNGNDIWSYKYVNLSLHLLCGLLIYWLTALLLAHTRFVTHRWSLGLLTAAMWLMAPMWVSTTLYVVQRMAQLSTLFCLAGLLCFVVGRQRLSTQRRTGLLGLAGCFALFLPLAAFSKENGVLLPLLALCIELFFFRFKGDRFTRYAMIALFTALVAIPAAAGLLFLLFKGSYFSNVYALRDFTFTERVLTEPRILFSYIHGLLLPDGGSFGLYHDDYPLSENLISPLSTLLSILTWGILVLIPLVIRNDAARWLSFGVIFFLAGHSLESSILPLELYFEHRNYLPAYGIFFTVTIAVAYLLPYIKKTPASVVIISLIPVAYATATYQRVQTWSSFELMLLSDAVRHPRSFRLNTELATYYANKGDLPAALSKLDTAESINPKAWSGIALQRIALFCLRNEPIPAEFYHSLTAKRSLYPAPYTTTALEVIRTLLQKNTCPSLDKAALSEAMETWVNDPIYQATAGAKWKILVELGQIQFLANQSADAIDNLKLALQQNPTKLDVGFVIVQYQLASGDFEGAKKMLDDLAMSSKNSRDDYQAVTRAYVDILNQLETAATKKVL